MSRLRIFLLLFALLIIALAWWLYRRSNAPPEVAFERVRRETLVTNRKVELSAWVPGAVLVELECWNRGMRGRRRSRRRPGRA